VVNSRLQHLAPWEPPSCAGGASPLTAWIKTRCGARRATLRRPVPAHREDHGRTTTKQRVTESAVWALVGIGALVRPRPLPRSVAAVRPDFANYYVEQRRKYWPRAQDGWPRWLREHPNWPRSPWSATRSWGSATRYSAPPNIADPVVASTLQLVAKLVLGGSWWRPCSCFGRRLNRGGPQRDADAISASRRKPAGQRQVCSDERSCRQRIALTLRTMGAFAMTHHVECVALLVPR